MQPTLEFTFKRCRANGIGAQTGRIARILTAVMHVTVALRLTSPHSSPADAP